MKAVQVRYGRGWRLATLGVAALLMCGLAAPAMAGGVRFNVGVGIGGPYPVPFAVVQPGYYAPPSPPCGHGWQGGWRQPMKFRRNGYWTWQSDPWGRPVQVFVPYGRGW